MGVINIHRRLLPCSEHDAGALIDALSSDDDLLWPNGHWPPMRFDRPLQVGARGGHGPIRYQVEAYAPGRWVRFRFRAPGGFDGYHEYCVLPGQRPGRALLQHQLTMRVHGLARLTWPVAYRWMHDALIEDSLDRAAARCSGVPAPVPSWSPQVRLLRLIAQAVGLAGGSTSTIPVSR